MSLKHKVTINVARPGGIRDPVLKSGSKSIRSRLLNWLFGEKVGVFVITPGDSVETVEIKEIKEGGVEHEQNQTASGCCHGSEISGGQLAGGSRRNCSQ